jgi:hypothetical protein
MTDAEFVSLRWQDLYYLKTDKGFRYLIRLRSTHQDLIEIPTMYESLHFDSLSRQKEKKHVIIEYELNYDYMFLPLGPYQKWGNSIVRIREADLYKWEITSLSDDEKAKVWLSI